MFLLQLDIKTLSFSILGGVAIFLLGITLMSDYLKKIAGSKLKLILEKTTNNPLKGILTGLVLTALIQSSGATIAIVIGLVSANLLSLRNAVGVMLGSKIGTTVTSLLISFNLGSYALIIIFIGVIISLFVKHKTISNIGGAILGFGLLFFGLNIMSDSLSILTTTETFQNFLISANKHPILGLLIGIITTAIIQSSSATIGILQEAYTSGAIPLFVAVAIVLGSNIGNTITSIIAAIKANNEGRKVAFIHVLISVISSFVLLIFIRPYTNLLISISTFLNIDSTNSMLTISLAHIIFNVITVLAMFWFIKQFIWLANLIFKRKTNIITKRIILNKQLIKVSPELALENVNEAIYEMGLFALQMFDLTENYAIEGEQSLKDLALQCEDTINQLDIEIHNYLVQLGAQDLNQRQMQKIAKDIDTVTDLERIGDHLDNIIEIFIVKHNNKYQITEEVKQELVNFYQLVKNQLTSTIKAYYTYDLKEANNIIKKEYYINGLFKEYRNNNTLRISQNLQENHFNYYVDILSNLERIADHCYNIAENIIHENFIYTKKEVVA